MQHQIILSQQDPSAEQDAGTDDYVNYFTTSENRCCLLFSGE